MKKGYMYQLHREQTIDRPLPEVFDFFSRAENLEVITPPWLHFRILTPLPIEMREGAQIAYQIRIHGIPVRWLSEIESWEPPQRFVDVQLRGPYRIWRHTHSFEPMGNQTIIRDSVEFDLPFGMLGRLAYRLQVARDIGEIFDYRVRKIDQLLAQERKWRS
jgi:ligand-binding SRPBCC domain-containing protein